MPGERHRRDKGDRRLRALVVVHAVAFQPVETPSGGRVPDGSAGVVVPEEPPDSRPYRCLPAPLARERVGARGGVGHGGGLDRLLVERRLFAPRASSPYWGETEAPFKALLLH